MRAAAPERRSGAGETQPAGENLVFRKELQRQFVCSVDVFGITRKRDPAERASSGAEERANIFRDKTGNEESVGAASIEGETANIIAVIEGNGSCAFKASMAFTWTTMEAVERRTYSSGSRWRRSVAWLR